MSEPTRTPLTVKYLSILFIGWLGLWILALPFIPRELYGWSLFICGIAPVIGWFLIRPQRVRWFILVLFGLDS